MVKTRSRSRKYLKRKRSVTFGAPIPVHVNVIRPLVVRKPGLFGKGRKRSHRGRKSRKFGVVNPGYEGINFPGTYVDYFAQSVPNVVPSSWFWPVVDGQAQSSPSIIANMKE